MAVTECNYGQGMGGGVKDYAYSTQSGMTAISTTEKAKGFCASFYHSGTNYIVYCFDGVNGNNVYRNGVDLEITATFGDSSITLSSDAGAFTYNVCVIY